MNDPAIVVDSPSVVRRLSIHQVVDGSCEEDVIAVLKKKPALINSKNKEGYTPLHTACLKGNFECAELLITLGDKQKPRIDLDAKDPTGWTPIHCASLNGHADCVRLLLEKGADARATTSNGSTALHYAASW